MTTRKARVNGYWQLSLGGVAKSSIWNGWDPSSTTTPPTLSGYPTAATTGVPPTVALTTYSGNYSSSSAGQVIESLNITGTLTITHSGVIVKNCRIQNMVSPFNDTKIWACEIGRRNPVNDGTNYRGFRFGCREVKRCNFYGWTDSMQPNNNSGITMTIQDNLYHDHAASIDASQSAGEGGYNWSHNDHIQIIAGDNYYIYHNTFMTWGFNTVSAYGPLQTVTNNPLLSPTYGIATKSGLHSDGYGPTNSAMIINSGVGATSIVFDSNRVIGASSAYIYNAYPLYDSNVTISNNRFGRQAVTTIATDAHATWSGNVWDDDGTAVT